MMMMKADKRGMVPLPLILVGVGVFLVIIALAAANQLGGGSGNSGGSNVKIECGVTLENIGFDNKGAHIREFNCQKVGKCNLFSLSVGELGIFRSSTVYVRLYADDGVTSHPVKVEVTDEFLTDSSKTVLLNVCTSSNSGSIKVYDKDNLLVENKPWSLS